MTSLNTESCVFAIPANQHASNAARQLRGSPARGGGQHHGNTRSFSMLGLVCDAWAVMYGESSRKLACSCGFWGGTACSLLCFDRCVSGSLTTHRQRLPAQTGLGSIQHSTHRQACPRHKPSNSTRLALFACAASARQAHGAPQLPLHNHPAPGPHQRWPTANGHSQLFQCA